MPRSYYPLWYRLDSQDRYLIWFSHEDAVADSDGVTLEANGSISVFVSLSALVAHAQAARLELSEGELCLHNLDTVVKWIKVKRPRHSGPYAIDCAEFLAAWNLFTDVAWSLGENFDADRERTQRIYQKLFFGNNLPAITPVGKHYTPLWSNHERRIIHEVMAAGLRLFMGHTRLL